MINDHDNLYGFESVNSKQVKIYPIHEWEKMYLH